MKKKCSDIFVELNPDQFFCSNLCILLIASFLITAFSLFVLNWNRFNKKITMEMNEEKKIKGKFNKMISFCLASSNQLYILWIVFQNNLKCAANKMCQCILIILIILPIWIYIHMLNLPRIMFCNTTLHLHL